MFDEYYRRKPWEDTDHDISEHQSELATSLRIPILRTAWPRWNYITGIVVCDDGVFDAGIMPTDDEIRLLGAHLAEYNKYYNQGFLEAMRQFAPYDIDGGANLGYYLKRHDGGWCYRKRTWRDGCTWWPTAGYHHLDGSRKWRHTPEGYPDKSNAVVLPLSHVLRRNFNGWPARWVA